MRKPNLVVSPTEEQQRYLSGRKKCMKCGTKILPVVSVKDPKWKADMNGVTCIDGNRSEWVRLCQKCSSMI